jgi:hypothetical protein
VVDTDVALVGFRGQEGYDVVQSNAGISMVWSLFHIASNRERGSAGDASASASFGHATNCLIPCELRPRKGFRACARGWGGDRGRREVAEYQYCAGIGRRCMQACGTPTSDFAAAGR